MPWWAWLLVAGFAVVACSAGALWALWRHPVGAAFLRLGGRGKIRFLRTVAFDRGLAWPLRAMIAVVVVYLALPIDIIPDFIPILGQLDDVIIVAAALYLLFRFVPRERLEAALAAGAGRGNQPSQN